MLSPIWEISNSFSVLGYNPVLMGFPLLFSDQIKYFKGPKDTKGVIRTRKSKNNRQYKWPKETGQNDKP